MPVPPPFTVSPGQLYPGQKIETVPTVFGAKVTAAGGLAIGGNSPTVAILAGAGTVGSITSQAGYDQAGSFVLTAGTASLTGGSLASVTFGQPLTAAPIAVIVDAGFTSGTLGLSVGAVSLSKTGFVVQGQTPSSGAAYVISYLVIRSPLA